MLEKASVASFGRNSKALLPPEAHRFISPSGYLWIHYNIWGLAHVGPIPEILTALTLKLQG
jgi:hypothetical protein